MFLWHYKVGLIKYSETISLVRLAHIRGDIIHAGKAYRDYDPLFSLDKEPAKKAVEDITRAAGFKFPLPIGPSVFNAIMGLRDFPTFEQFGEVYSEHLYPQEDYRADLRNFWGQRQPGMCRTHEQLYNRILTSTRRLIAKESPLDGAYLNEQGQSTYARLVKENVVMQLARLDEFWGAKDTPENVKTALFRLLELEKSYTPPVSKGRNLEEKLVKASKTPASRSKKTIKGIDDLWDTE